MSEAASLLDTLHTRFEANPRRHPDVQWSAVLRRLETNPQKLQSLHAMETSGGEPDVVVFASTGDMAWFDCAPESPLGRRSLCYDQPALKSRKEHPPKGSAVSVAKEMGIELLTEEDYRFLQSIGEFDLKTSSWLSTPADVRALGGAIFGDRRYGRVFIFHNGAESYYASRGFRAKLVF